MLHRGRTPVRREAEAGPARAPPRPPAHIGGREGPLPPSLRRPEVPRSMPVVGGKRGAGAAGGYVQRGCLAAGAWPRPVPYGGMLRQRYGQLLARLEQGLQLLELCCNVEEGGCV